MIQRDYIMRMAEMVAKALAKVLHLKEEKRYDEALEEINLAGKELLGDDFKILKNLSDVDIIKWLFSGGNFDSKKCVSLSKLLMAEGEVFELMGDYKRGLIRYLQSLNLLNEAVTQNDQNGSAENLEMMKYLMNKTANERTK
ncbi:hypothetical protein JNM05_02325 [bacterium]|nr:hypothetical protein [bacterium]